MEATWLVFTRGTEAISLYLPSAHELTIVVTDADALPRARIVDQGIALAMLEIPLPGAQIIAKGDTSEEGFWEAEWELRGIGTRQT